MPDSEVKIAILGYSGHAFVVSDAAIAMKLNLTGYLDRFEAQNNPLELEYLGDESRSKFNKWTDYRFILGIGDNFIREKVADRIIQNNGMLLNVIHPHSSVSSHISLGNGNFIARNVAINPFCRIGNRTIVNTSASIDHECILEDGVHIAPGAVLAGNVRVGRNSFIGANAVIKEGVTIGDNVMVGAGTVILNNILSNTKVVGNPARKLN